MNSIRRRAVNAGVRGGSLETIFDSATIVPITYGACASVAMCFAKIANAANN